MILMQTGYSLLAAENPNAPLYVGIVIGLIAVLVVVGVLINRARSKNFDTQTLSGHAFRRVARGMGLSNPHTELLLSLVQASKVKQPFLVFSSSKLLDDILRKGMYSIDSARNVSDEEKETRKAALFEIKQTLESQGRKGASLKSTLLVKPGQALTVTPETGGHFPSKIVSNSRDFLAIATPPADAQGNARWMRGTKLSVYFWRENDAGYSFSSKVLGYDTVKEVPCVLIQHGKALRREQRRGSKRKPIMRACFFHPIKILEVGEGRRTVRKAVVETNQRMLGTVVDLSAGGCAVQAMNPFDPGALVMIEFDIDRKAPIRAFGKVKLMSRLTGKGGIMHVMFTKVTREYLNRIRSFVYDFGRSSAGQQEDASPSRGASSRAAGFPRPRR